MQISPVYAVEVNGQVSKQIVTSGGYVESRTRRRHDGIDDAPARLTRSLAFPRCGLKKVQTTFLPSDFFSITRHAMRLGQR
jgi:hypothetical protein